MAKILVEIIQFSTHKRPNANEPYDQITMRRGDFSKYLSKYAPKAHSKHSQYGQGVGMFSNDSIAGHLNDDAAADFHNELKSNTDKVAPEHKDFHDRFVNILSRGTKSYVV